MTDSDASKIIEVPTPTLTKKVNGPDQTANVLCHFSKKLKYLVDTLKHQAFIPRYNNEIIDYLNIEELKEVSFPMTCFCDIKFTKLKSHVHFYGNYGIALRKEWGLSNNIQPIQYINPCSQLMKDFSIAMNYALSSTDKDNMDKLIEPVYKNYLLDHLLFMKPLRGTMVVDNETIDKNFHDENEWRYVPKIDNSTTHLPLLIPTDLINKVPAINAYSDGIRKSKKLWLEFHDNDIKYIFVKNIEDRDKLIKHISQRNHESIKNQILISKILVYEELMEDW
ncbi:abortive infection system antitoxin AbiGi family protein [Sporolactobacillus terrae]|uniref:abortive infection system antitoxin AbiGi family protein n=1 Tax=Sporolactobacillus terrae TaxID=269673 RepID=UPI00048D6236|nr:abortive infection system antitoxin AbiGi family protein [Sporolactobacillus terrae]